MNTTKKHARVAGLLYLLLAVTAPIYLVYVPNKLIVARDVVATGDRIRASEGLFRLGIASEVLSATISIFVVLALYRLFKPVSEKHAFILMILSFLQVPISFLNSLNHIAALILFKGAQFLSVFDKPQQDALGFLFIRLHGQGIVVASLFWGLWLFPFGILVMRSGFIPRALGVLLIVAGCAYLASSLTSLLLPAYAHAVDRVAMALEVGELPIILWLAIWGARGRPDAPTAAIRARG
jgi:hypothetical protein